MEIVRNLAASCTSVCLVGVAVIIAIFAVSFLAFVLFAALRCFVDAVVDRSLELLFYGLALLLGFFLLSACFSIVLQTR